MNKFIFHSLLFLFVFNSCEFVETTQNPEGNISNLPLSAGLFIPQTQSQGHQFTEIKSWSGDQVLVFQHEYFPDQKVFNRTSDDIVSIEIEYYSLSNQGWQLNTSVEYPQYNTDSERNLVRNSAVSSMTCLHPQQISLANQNIETALGEHYNWASNFSFGEEAIQYSCQYVLNNTAYILNSDCNSACRNLVNLEQVLTRYKVTNEINVDNGFYWLGLSIFLTDAGNLEIYSYFYPENGLLSNEGTWEMVEVNGEQILQFDIPANIKHDIGITEEANPIFSMVDGQLKEGTILRPMNTEEKQSRAYFLNQSAMDDISNAFIAIQ